MHLTIVTARGNGLWRRVLPLKRCQCHAPSCRAAAPLPLATNVVRQCCCVPFHGMCILVWKFVRDSWQCATHQCLDQCSSAEQLSPG